MMLVLALLLLPLVAAASRHQEQNWRVEHRVISPDGFPRAGIIVVDIDQTVLVGDVEFDNREIMLGDNGRVPGPVLRVKTGDHVVVHVHNALHDSRTSIHWHGLHMLGQAWMDGTEGITECGIGPGGTQSYVFNITQARGLSSSPPRPE